MLSQPTNCVAPPTGLVSWWRAEGNARDSVGSNHGLIIDGVHFATAVVGDGFVFSGSGDDYVRLPADLFPVPVTGTGTAPFSFEVWFSTVVGGAVLGQQDQAPFDDRLGGYVPALYVGTNGLLYAQMFWGDGAQLASATNVNDGKFHYAAVTYDGTSEVLYVDGLPAASTPFTQRAYTGTYQYQLGTAFTGGWTNAPGGWFPFTGVVDEPALYNRALTPDEVAGIFGAGGAGKCVGMAWQALRHRYSFDGPASTTVATDTATAANGVVLYGSATTPYTNGAADGSALTGNGSLDLKGTDGYVSLPPYLISSLSGVSLEAWVTWSGPSSTDGQRILDFGANGGSLNSPGSGTNYLMLSPSTGPNHVLGFQATTAEPAGAGTNARAVTLYGSTPLPVGQPTYIAVTYDPIDGLSQLFVNGMLVRSSYQALDPLAQFNDQNNWLGRAEGQSAPFFNGQYDEVRIWEGTLTPTQVADHFAAGPAQALPVPAPAVEVSASGQDVTVSWRGDLTTGYHLEHLPSLPSSTWVAVTNGVTLTRALYQYSVPGGQVEGFYRLKK